LYRAEHQPLVRGRTSVAFSPLAGQALALIDQQKQKNKDVIEKQRKKILSKNDLF